jgi:hypothetical protein
MHQVAKMQEITGKFHLGGQVRSGTTLVELAITMVIGAMLTFAVGMLLAGAQRTWNRTYNSVNNKAIQDAKAAMITFGVVGRKANRTDYILYALNGSTYNPAQPQTADQEVVIGDAVEFRYWDVELDTSDSHQLVDVSKTATAYGFFYIDDGELKVDYGPYPPGAIPEGGGIRNTTGVTTLILAENVTVDPNIPTFSHTTIGGVGQGSVRIGVTLTNPEDGKTVTLMTATLTRNIWPR